MSTTPIFDMSKATPIFDMSKAVALEQEDQPSAYSKLTSGYNQNVEDWAQSHPVAGPIVRFLDATGGAAMSSPEATYNFVHDLIQGQKRLFTGDKTPTPLEESLISGIQGWADPNVRKAAVSLLPEALGQGFGSVAGGEVMGKLGQIAPKGIKSSLPENLGEKLRDPETNELKPGVKITAKIAGTGIGHLVGLPGYGEFGGFLLGPDVADLLIPDHPDYIKAQADKVLRAEGKPVPITKSPNYDPAAYRAGRLGTQPEPQQPSPFAGMTSTTPANVAQLSTAQATPSVRTTPFPGPQPPALLASRFPQPEAVQPGVEPLVKTPEVVKAEEQLQKVAEKLAKIRGMQYAGGVRTAGPNLPVNRLFP